MLREHVLRLLQDIDRVECDLRRLEARLTAIRVKIRSELLGDRDVDYVPELEQKTQR